MIQTIRAKTILSRYKEPDPWFGIRYSMNLYRGCQHQCIYCDTRSECYGIKDLRDILIKENAIELLDKELRGIRRKGTIGTGSMNDPYMPVEETYRMTGKALEVIALHKFPVHVMTKSDLVLRDIDILKDIAQVFATVSFTVTTADGALASRIEPGAPSPSARFEAMTAFAKASIHVGVSLMPVIPCLTDTVANIRAIIERSRDSGAEYILPAFGMTLRDKQRDYFFEKLREFFPEVLAAYRTLYKGTYQFSCPQADKIDAFCRSHCAEYGIACTIPRYEEKEVRQYELF